MMENVKIIKDENYDFDVVAIDTRKFEGAWSKFDELEDFDWGFETEFFKDDFNMLVKVNEDDEVTVECYWDDDDEEFQFDDTGNYVFTPFENSNTEDFLRASVEDIFEQVWGFMHG